ncbi:hypothetical protein [Myxosarcina sp. GI1(2024)]
MLISDLPYLETVSYDEKVAGGNYLLAITSHASAQGDNAYTLATTEVVLENKGKKVKANGEGIALAVSEKHYADVDVYSAGFEKVKIKTKHREEENYSFETVRVKAK